MPPATQSDPLPTKEHRRLHAACTLHHARKAWRLSAPARKELRLATRELIKTIFPRVKIPLPEEIKK